ncbi:unnamed protein product, partial [Rotaria socialis]
INDDQTSTVDILEPNNSDDSQQQYVSSTTNISSLTTAVIMKHRRVKRVYMLRTSPYGLHGNGSGLQLNDSNDKLANTTNEENFDTQSREVQFGNEFDLNRENVLNFEYGTVELDMLNSKFSNIYFDCSPYHIINRELQQVIQQVDIKRIIPESSAPHLQIPERPNIWESHPIFVGRVYQLIAELFDIPLRQAPNQLLKKL